MTKPRLAYAVSCLTCIRVSTGTFACMQSCTSTRAFSAVGRRTRVNDRRRSRRASRGERSASCAAVPAWVGADRSRQVRARAPRLSQRRASRSCRCRRLCRRSQWRGQRLLLHHRSQIGGAVGALEPTCAGPFRRGSSPRKPEAARPAAVASLDELPIALRSPRPGPVHPGSADASGHRDR